MRPYCDQPSFQFRRLKARRKLEKAPQPTERLPEPKLRNVAGRYAFFLAFSAFNAKAKRDLYRFAVFSASVRRRIDLSISE